MHTTGLNRLTSVCAEVDSICTRCGACLEQCAFLRKYGNPGDIAWAVRHGENKADPFECSLCGLCDAVCPETIRPDTMFLEMRRSAVQAGDINLKRYAPLLAFEVKGDSSLFSLIRLPKGGDTVLFPGCALPATRTRTVRNLFKTLQPSIPDLGIALGCCLKPSHDLGRQDHFTERFERLRGKLLDAGVRRLVTTCPNCFKVFTAYCPDLQIVTAYDLLAEAGISPAQPAGGEYVVHDPCPGRFEHGTQDAVRSLAKACDIELLPMENSREKTLCCGEGGSVGFVNPEFANGWTEIRRTQAGDKKILTSCVGCKRYLSGPVQVDHVLDILLGSKPRFTLPQPFGDLGRLWLKRWFVKTIP